MQKITEVEIMCFENVKLNILYSCFLLSHKQWGYSETQEIDEAEVVDMVVTNMQGIRLEVDYKKYKIV